MMKIYLVSIQYIPHITGGGGIVVRDLSVELTKVGDDVTVLCLGLKDKEEEIIEIDDGSGTHAIKVKRFFTSDSNKIINPYEGTKEDEFKRFEEFTNGVFEYLKDKEGIIHLHGHYEVPALAKRIKENGLKNPTIVSFSALESVALDMEKEKNAHILNHIKEREEIGLKYCDYAIVNSEKVKAQLKAKYPSSFSERKVFAIPNYVSNEHIHVKTYYGEELINMRRKYKLNDSNPLIYHIGRFDKIKGIEYLINAMEIVCSNINFSVSLLVCGFLEDKQKNYFDHLSNLASRVMNKCSNVEIKLYSGQIEVKDRLCLFDSCSFLVTPAIIEPFGLTTLEAWARGKAVIRSDNEGSRYLFNIKNQIPVPFLKNDKGLVVNFESNRTENLAAAITFLLQNPDITKKMGEKGRKTVFKKYSWKKPIRIYRRLYQKTKFKTFWKDGRMWVTKIGSKRNREFFDIIK